MAGPDPESRTSATKSKIFSYLVSIGRISLSIKEMLQVVVAEYYILVLETVLAVLPAIPRTRLNGPGRSHLLGGQ